MTTQHAPEAVTETELRDLLRSVPEDPRAAGHLLTNAYLITSDTGQRVSPTELFGYLRAGNNTVDENSRMLLQSYTFRRWSDCGYFVDDDAYGLPALWQNVPGAQPRLLVEQHALNRDPALWPALLTGLGIREG